MTPRKKTSNTASGSPPGGGPEYLLVGSLRRAHGVRGEMVMEVVTDFPERLQRGVQLFAGAEHQTLVLEGVRPHNEGLLVKFEGVDTPEAAARYRNQDLYVTAADRPALPAGHYYEHEVLGFTVIDNDSGEVIGSLSGILRTGANDIYVVQRPNGGELLLPVIASVVLQLDAAARTIRVHLLPGLADDRGS